MKLNLIETVETGGALNDDQYRLQEYYNIFQMQKSTDATDCLILDDLNFDRDNLLVPEDETVKKVLLTYNGIDYESNQVYETLVYDSKSTLADGSDMIGYANSNIWKYCPSSFKQCVETTWDPACESSAIKSDNPPGVSIVTNWPQDTCTQPYDWGHGIVVKKFLVGEANLTNEYYVRYSAPEWYDVYPSNVRGGNVYTDGWYSGYYHTVFKWGAASLPAYSVGLIVWHNDTFWRSLVGSGVEPGTTDGDWVEVASLQEWIDFAILLQNDTVNDLGYYLQNQYLVTCQLNDAILNEVMRMANTTPLDFGANCISQWVKFTQKKAGAVANFYNENFKDAQRILEQTRDLYLEAENMGINTIGRNI